MRCAPARGLSTSQHQLPFRSSPPCSASLFLPFLFCQSLPLSYLSFPAFLFLQPSPTLCSLSNLAAPMGLIPGVVERVIMIEKKIHPKNSSPGGGLQYYFKKWDFDSKDSKWVFEMHFNKEYFEKRFLFYKEIHYLQTTICKDQIKAT